MTERELVIEFVDYFNNQGMCAVNEIALFDGSVDIMIRNNDETWLIEAKLSDWRRAIKQCRCHYLASDKVFILMPKFTPKSIRAIK